MRPAGRTPRVRLMLAILVAAAPAAAQVPEFPDSLMRQRIVLRTDRFASTHTTSLAADMRFEQDAITGTVRTFLLSSTSLLDLPATKDQVDALVDLEYRLRGSMRVFLISEGTLSNDVRNNLTTIPGINNTATDFTGIGLRYVDDDGNRVGAAVGGAYNRQLNVEDAGMAVYGEIAADLPLEDYRVRIDGRGRWHNLAPRRIGNANVAMRFDRDFEEGAFASLDATLDMSGTDLYLKRPEQEVIDFGGPSYEAVQSRAETRIRLQPNLRVMASDDIELNLAGLISTVGFTQHELNEGLPPMPRDPVPYKYGREDLEIGASAGMTWAPDPLRAMLHFEYTSREQRNEVDAIDSVPDLELRKQREAGAENNFVSRHLLLSGGAEVRLGVRDTVAVTGSASIYRYDTPSPTNYFDRDEQVLQAQVKYARGFSEYLGGSVALQAFLTHLVYLSGRNSNDNNWNRVFRFVPAVNYQTPGGFVNRFQAEVAANYTDYDFEGRTQNVRGRSFRELHLLDSLEVPIGSSMTAALRGDLRISERGSFSWDRFAESLLERTRTEGLEGEISTELSPNFSAGAGARLSRLRTLRTGSTGLLAPFSDRTSAGPIARLVGRFADGSVVEISGWWEHRFEESVLVAKVPWFVLTVGYAM